MLPALDQRGRRRDRGVLAIDGKTLRGSLDKANGKAAIHMVSAWAADNGVIFGQVATDAKSNEIAAIPAILKLLEIRGLIVTIDAMGGQEEIAAQIVAKGADDVLEVIRKGIKKANVVAEETLGMAKKAMGLGFGGRVVG